MDASDGFIFEELLESNFHNWKQKIELVLVFRELSDNLGDRPSLSNANDACRWEKGDANAKVVIGLSLRDDHLEHDCRLESASEMWKIVQNLFQLLDEMKKWAMKSDCLWKFIFNNLTSRLFILNVADSTKILQTFTTMQNIWACAFAKVRQNMCAFLVQAHQKGT